MATGPSSVFCLLCEKSHSDFAPLGLCVFALKSLRDLGLGFLAGLGRFESEEGFVNAGADRVDLGLKVVEVFVQALLDDFVHVRKREVRAKLTQQLFRRGAEGATPGAGDGVK